jgi:hypothetical protein
VLLLHPHPDNLQMLFPITITLSQLGEGETALAVTLLVVRVRVKSCLLHQHGLLHLRVILAYHADEVCSRWNG